ncbi:MAG: NAD(P)H-dependent oxidoreductase [Alphaproteobacteria bacterium]|nr:NAD(P)H-dependent oxidoreductase [Alphaproteobacteria bacterium]
MSKIIVIIGHVRPRTYCEALGAAYARGARAGGHEVALYNTSAMTFDPILRGAYEELQPLEPDLCEAHDALLAADHIVFVFPLWLGTMPAILKAFLERVVQPDIIGPAREGRFVQILKGKSARVIMTMGMPGFVYRWWFGAHALKVLKRNILGFLGVAPIRTTIHGSITAVSDAKRSQWLDDAEALGRNAG